MDPISEPAAVPTIPVVKQPVVVVTPKMILDNIMSKLPTFTAKNDLELLLMILTTYIGTDAAPVAVQLGAEKAIKNLITFKKISSVDDIDAAHMNVIKSLVSSMAGAYSLFEAETGGKFDRADFDVFANEFSRESAEQDGLRKTAEDALDRVRKICGELGLANPDPALSASSSKPVEKHNVVRNVARAIGGAFFKLGTDEKPDAVSDNKPGWTTPPVLGKDFYDIGDFITTIVDYMKALEEQKKTNSKVDVASGTLSFYAAQGYTREKILEELSKYCTFARDQIEQSGEIMTNILPDYNSVKDIVQTVNDTKAIVNSVKAYCHSA